MSEILKNSNKLENKINDFLKNTTNVLLRRSLKTLVFLEGSYATISTTIYNINYLNLNKRYFIENYGENVYGFLRTTPFFTFAFLFGLTFAGVKFSEYLYNKAATRDFENNSKTK